MEYGVWNRDYDLHKNGVDHPGLITTKDVNPLGWLAHERTARGRGLGGQLTYIV